MTGALYRLAHLCIRHKLVVVLTWLLVTVALVVVSQRLGEQTNDNLSLPGTNSQRASDTLAQSFPDQSNGSSPIVLHAKKGTLTEPKYAAAVERSGQVGEQSATRRLGRQSAHPAGRLGAQQGQDDRLSVGDAGGEPGRALRLEKPETIIDAARSRQPPPALRSRPAGSSARRSPNPPPSPAS